MRQSFFQGPFVPFRKVTEGEGGEILLAQQQGVGRFRRTAVFARLDPRLKRHTRASRCFLEDMSSVVAFNHPNIAHIYDIGEEQAGYFVVANAYRGHRLKTLIERAEKKGIAISIDIAVNIARQVLEGLEHAHGFCDDTGRIQSIVHGNIGPETIHIGVDGGVKIIDFGLARAERCIAEEWDESPRQFSYMSFEALKNNLLDTRADLFSIGMVLYELTVGRRFVRGDSFRETLRRADEPIPPPTFLRPQYPVDLERIVMRALEIDPNDRYQSAENMLEDIDAFDFNAGLRISRLQLRRFFARVFGALKVSVLDDEAEQEAEKLDEAFLGPATDELDFDQGAIFNDENEATKNDMLDPLSNNEEIAHPDIFVVSDDLIEEDLVLDESTEVGFLGRKCKGHSKEVINLESELDIEIMEESEDKKDP